jgi:hypothetical protein
MSASKIDKIPNIYNLLAIIFLIMVAVPLMTSTIYKPGVSCAWMESGNKLKKTGCKLHPVNDLFSGTFPPPTILIHYYHYILITYLIS